MVMLPLAKAPGPGITSVDEPFKGFSFSLCDLESITFFSPEQFLRVDSCQLHTIWAAAGAGSASAWKADELVSSTSALTLLHLAVLPPGSTYSSHFRDGPLESVGHAPLILSFTFLGQF